MHERSRVSSLVLPMTTTIVTDAAEFERLQADWDELLDASRQPSFFLRWRWNWLWWQHLAPADGRLHIMCCADGQGRLMGIAPLYSRPHRFLGIPYVYELMMLGTGIELKTSEYLDVFARRGAERAVGESIAACLRARPCWDRLWLLGVPDDSAVVPHLVQALGGQVSSTPCDSAPYVDTAVTWDEYKRSLGRSMRRNAEYYARRLFANFSCEFRLAESSDDLEPAIDHLVRLHQMRWQVAGQPGTFAEPHVESFLRTAMRQSHAEGRLRLWTLSVNGAVEAALVGFLDHGILHYFQKGFNPAYAKHDLGTVVLSLSIRACFDDPQIRAFDFMGGGLPYKVYWARNERLTVLHQARIFARAATRLCEPSVRPPPRPFARSHRRDYAMCGGIGCVVAAPGGCSDSGRQYGRPARCSASRSLSCG